MRALARSPEAAALRPAEHSALLRSPWHEERLLALLIWTRRFGRGDEAARRKIYEAYLASARWINHWDLVDVSAPPVVGAWLADRPEARGILLALAGRPSPWERRIAVVATFAFLRRGELGPTFELARAVMRDPFPLTAKAAGWMLREAGKRDGLALRSFLAGWHQEMPRTMLRHAIERFPRDERQAWLRGAKTQPAG